MSATDSRVSIDIGGAEEVLNGGLVPARSYMLSGDAGTGETVFGLHFPTEDVAAGKDH